MNDNPLAIGLGVRRCLAILMAITAVLGTLLFVRTLQLEYILQFDWYYIPPSLVIGLVIIFSASFAVRELMHKRVNGFAITVASILSLVMLLAWSMTIQNYLLMTIMFLYPPMTPAIAILSLVGMIALFWPTKKPRQ